MTSTFDGEISNAQSDSGGWSSRKVFVLASIGSAIGFGNVWRFPYYVHMYGGGTFLVPYFFALFALGIPSLILEMALGQLYQQV